MGTIKIGVIGKIVSGGNNKNGWYILIQPDSECSSCYYMFESPNMDFTSHGFDTYYTSLKGVENDLKSNEYIIEWFG